MIISLNSTDWLVFVTMMQRVSCDIGKIWFMEVVSKALSVATGEAI